MANDTTMRLRDQRKPGHGWFDNEIYDVFGDELQQNGISVYMTLARLCYGVRVTMSLREMAGHARMSKDTFGRTLKRVISLGLVVERKGATPQSASTYELVDVKELASAYLRAAVQKNKQATLPDVRSVSQRDSAPMPTLVELLSNRAVSGSVEPDANDDAACLTVRQDDELGTGVDKKIWVAPDATEVSQTEGSFETEVSHDVRHLRQDTRHNTQNNYPPTPVPGASGFQSAEAGSRNANANGNGKSRSFAALEDDNAKNNGNGKSQGLPGEREGTGCVGCSAAAEAVAKVMRECSLSNRRLERVIRAAMETQRAKSDALPDWNVVAEAMIRARKEYEEAVPVLSYVCGVRRFFAEGVWCAPSWPIDQAKADDIRRRNQAAVGTWRE